MNSASVVFDSHWAEEQDACDSLRHYRERFYKVPGTIYLDGNSLGLLSLEAESAVAAQLEAWKRLAIDGWMEAEPPWFDLSQTLAGKLAPLVGARSDEIAIANSTTVNLHQLLATLFEPDAGRNRVLADELNFPSDLYAISSHLRLRGLDSDAYLDLARSRDGRTLDEQDIISAIGPNTAMVILPSVLYRSGQLLDIKRLTAAAHARDCLIGFDCSHSIGVVPHSLDECGVDFAFWCTYKYLNAGPGAVGGLYLNRRHFGREPGLAGWFGCSRSKQFDMSLQFDPAEDAAALQIGTPPILSMAALNGALDLVTSAGIDRIRQKSTALTAGLIGLAEQLLLPHGFEIVTPREAERRGGHVALAHPEATRICKALKASGVIPDFRAPDVVRLAPSPLYTSFRDCLHAVETLVNIVTTGSYWNYAAGRNRVA